MPLLLYHHIHAVSVEFKTFININTCTPMHTETNASKQVWSLRSRFDSFSIYLTIIPSIRPTIRFSITSSYFLPLTSLVPLSCPPTSLLPVTSLSFQSTTQAILVHLLFFKFFPSIWQTASRHDPEVFECLKRRRKCRFDKGLCYGHGRTACAVRAPL